MEEAGGFLELSFKPLYDPTVLILDIKALEDVTPRTLGSAEPKKGVYVLVDTKPDRRGMYNVSVGHGGVNKRKNTEEGQQQTLYGSIKNLKSRPIPKEMKDWNKAILICDWQDDIEKRSTGNGSYQGKNDLIIQVMKQEVNHLSKFLHNELKKSKDLPLKVHSRRKTTYFMPNPDLRRYDYHVDVVKKMLQMIIDGYFEFP